ncbi:hypothetical protein L3X38_005634 [Prunus dulcis]|uniref:Uncharacterized protein n=1 Tax=Prunus dulcis TaxID=3755 RepID=A0AAD5F4A4_PRUDU|nr:hypothetical protein L3X38_005634 [Prunus dulcis]
MDDIGSRGEEEKKRTLPPGFSQKHGQVILSFELKRLNIYVYVDCSTSSVSSVIAKLAHYFKEEVVVFFL